MGGQTRTDILPYKFLIPVFGFFMPVTCTDDLFENGNSALSSGSSKRTPDSTSRFDSLERRISHGGKCGKPF